MTEARAAYRLRQTMRPAPLPEWTTATVEGVNIAAAQEWVVEWLALEEQLVALERARLRLMDEGKARDLPVPTLLEALRTLTARQRLETPPVVFDVCERLLTPLVEVV